MCRYFKKASLDCKYPLSQILLFVCCPQHDVKLSKIDHLFLVLLLMTDLPSPLLIHTVHSLLSEYVGGQ